ncbi:hypothetical protein [Arthrobacter sp. B1I2]|uniref:hypothetical protein n=1 Tax=Arthrobacter sp. B1I2 TaxID=3042263 RepID=UPI0027810DF3|nr:hypothetical protein [Arthrobacter sp. B1I2]MDQ0733468.1 hypothetical protein [Arthrobacter sp. B1I2]
MTASPVEGSPAFTLPSVRQELSVLDDLVTSAAVSYAAASVAGREDAAAAALAHYVDFSTKYDNLFRSLTPTLRAVL